MDKRFMAHYDPAKDVDKGVGVLNLTAAKEGLHIVVKGQLEKVHGTGIGRTAQQAKTGNQDALPVWPIYSKGEREWDIGK